MSRKPTPLRWGIERQREFFEFQLFWEDDLNRTDLTGPFGVPVIQASYNLPRHLKLVPDNMDDGSSGRTDREDEEFKARCLVPEVDGNRSQLCLIRTGLLPAQETRISERSAFGATPVPVCVVAVETLCAIAQAIHPSEVLEVKHPSFSCPRPDWRRIAPMLSPSMGSPGMSAPTASPIIASRTSCSRASPSCGARSRAGRAWLWHAQGQGTSERATGATIWRAKASGAGYWPQRPQDQQVVLLNREELMVSAKGQLADRLPDGRGGSVH